MFVTVKLLDKLKACKDQRNRFAELFPDGVELTRELIVQYAQEFSWTWCAANLAGDAGYAAYQQAEEQAWAVYRQADEPAWAIYLRAEEQAEMLADAAYQQSVAEAWAAYRQVEGSANAACNLARATAFADAIGL